MQHVERDLLADCSLLIGQVILFPICLAAFCALQVAYSSANALTAQPSWHAHIWQAVWNTAHFRSLAYMPIACRKYEEELPPRDGNPPRKVKHWNVASISIQNLFFSLSIVFYLIGPEARPHPPKPHSCRSPDSI
jgi:hypothetical protein